jgi:hypothetical protein
MRELGRAGVSRGVVLVRFRRLWELPENRDFVKDQFRRVQAGHHEWIPTNLIPEVVAAARSSADALMLDKWIDMQNEVRTPTSGLIFTDRVGVSSVVDSQGTTFSTLSGHVGAIYAPNPVENSQLTIGEYLWHDQLRTAFRVRNSPGAVLLRVKQIASTTVWDGRSVPPAVTYPGLYSRSKSRVATLTASQLGDDQQAVFQDLMKAFTGWIGKYST